MHWRGVLTCKAVLLLLKSFVSTIAPAANKSLTMSPECSAVFIAHVAISGVIPWLFATLTSALYFNRSSTESTQSFSIALWRDVFPAVSLASMIFMGQVCRRSSPISRYSVRIQTISGDCPHDPCLSAWAPYSSKI